MITGGEILALYPIVIGTGVIIMGIKAGSPGTTATGAVFGILGALLAYSMVTIGS